MSKHSVVAVTLALSLAACGKGKIDNTKVEGAITSGLKAKEITLKSVTCPARDQKKGDVFECEGTTNEGEKAMFRVEQTDDEGTVSWKFPGVIGTQAKLGAHLAPALGKGAVAKCPDKVIIVKKGTTFSCPGELEGKPAKLDFTAKDDEGNFHIKGKQDGATADMEGDVKEE